MLVDMELGVEGLRDGLRRFWERSGRSLAHLTRWDDSGPSPVVTISGRYAPRAWTDWTRGFLYGSMLLQFEASGDRAFYERALEGIRRSMPPYLTHRGVHDHGFNVVSTYGTLHRLALEGKLPAGENIEAVLRESGLALRVSGAVQAMRWTDLPGRGALKAEPRAGSLRSGAGFIHSFNGAHSLFIDTIRSLRSLALADALGQRLHEESDRVVDLLERLLQHAWTTVQYSIYYGEGRDRWDVPGRVSHEAIFNTVDGSFRSAATQQGYSPFTTWTRGLAWAILGLAEELQWLARLPEERLTPFGGSRVVRAWMERAARVVSEYYMRESFADGVPLWDTGAPRVTSIRAYPGGPSDPWNGYEPVDSSAAAIAAQGLLRFGIYLAGSELWGRLPPKRGRGPRLEVQATDRERSPVLEVGSDAKQQRIAAGVRYWQAGLTITATLLDTPYLNTDDDHQGLLLHSIYHHPRGWDHIPSGSGIPAGEASMWGDYHARELACYLWRLLEGESEYTFFGPRSDD